MQIISRQEAKARGLKRYFTGKPCVHGHVSERFVHGRCVQCSASANRSAPRERQRAYDRKWRLNNLEMARLKSREHARLTYKKSPELVRARSRTWKARNPQHLADYRRRWARENAALVNAHNARRRAATLRATPPWADHEKIAEKYERAVEQQRRFGRSVHVDHIVPLQGENVCGLHVHYNLQLMFGEDNIRKGNRI